MKKGRIAQGDKAVDLECDAGPRWMAARAKANRRDAEVQQNREGWVWVVDPELELSVRMAFQVFAASSEQPLTQISHV